MRFTKALVMVVLCLSSPLQAKAQELAVADLAICSDATLPTTMRVAELGRRGWIDCQATVPKADFMQAIDILGALEPLNLPAQRKFFDHFQSRAQAIGPTMDGTVMCNRSLRALLSTSKEGRPGCLFTSAEPHFDALALSMSLKVDEEVGQKRSLSLDRRDVRISVYEFAEEWRPGFELDGGTMFVASFRNRYMSEEVSP